MSTEPKQGWWYRASIKQRLAQIDGGIECGMSTRQIAMVSGVDMDNHPSQIISAFANENKRSFAGSRRKAHPSITRHAHILRDRAAYFRGESIDMWGEEPRHGEA